MIRLRENHADAPLSIRGLAVAYGDRLALGPVDWDVARGACTAVVGPNGAGKSTLLKAALGLVRPLRGSTRFFGEPLRRVRSRVAYVPQRESVDWEFPATALDVVTMGRYGRLGWLRRVGDEDRRVARRAIERLGLAGLETRPIGELSGGQQQRVFVARALAADAELLLLDEPFAGVDAATEHALFEVLDEFVRAGGTAVVVHHDLESVPQHFDRALLLDTRAVAEGPIDAVWSGENLARTFRDRRAAAAAV